jgi:hypothetical protein
MSDTHSNMPLPQLVTELATLCREGSTGTVFIATDDNRLARLSLNAGEIELISFHNKRGAEALALIPNIHAGRLRFDEGHKTATGTGGLPPTADILEFLSNSPAPDTEIAPSAGRATHQHLTADDRRMIEDTLAEFIGPMASIVCEEHLDQATDLESALSKLAADIDDPAQANDFLAQVHAHYGKRAG